MVLLPKLISHPSVPNHLKLTPAVPGPPLAPGVCAPSATPGNNALLQSVAAAASPAATPAPRNRRRETSSATERSEAGSRKHMGGSVPPGRGGERCYLTAPAVSPET